MRPAQLTRNMPRLANPAIVRTRLIATPPLSQKLGMRAMATTTSGLGRYPRRTVTLNTGQVVPSIGLGTFQDPDEQEMSVYTALKCGYRHIDTAHKSVFPPSPYPHVAS